MRPSFAWLTAAFIAATLQPALAEPSRVVERPDFGHYFADAGTQGTMIVHDLGKDVWFVTNLARAETGYLPSSTFKIFNALAGLSLGAVRDPDSETFSSDGSGFKVGGKALLPAACTGEISLRMAFTNSCIPVYQSIARRAGIEPLRKLLAQSGYGNGQIDSVPVDWFWLKGDFRVSAWDQLGFLDRLYRDDLPFTPTAMAQVRDLMAGERGPDWVIRAKTGYAYTVQPAVGWWIGWVERDGRAWEFALNLDVTAPDHLKARMGIAKSILHELGALPAP